VLRAHRVDTGNEAAPDLFAEVERKAFSVKGRAQAVVAYECRPA
jgi:hypothetical protein